MKVKPIKPNMRFVPTAGPGIFIVRWAYYVHRIDVSQSLDVAWPHISAVAFGTQLPSAPTPAVVVRLKFLFGFSRLASVRVLDDGVCVCVI